MQSGREQERDAVANHASSNCSMMSSSMVFFLVQLENTIDHCCKVATVGLRNVCNKTDVTSCEQQKQAHKQEPYQKRKTSQVVQCRRISVANRASLVLQEHLVHTWLGTLPLEHLRALDLDPLYRSSTLPARTCNVGCSGSPLQMVAGSGTTPPWRHRIWER